MELSNCMGCRKQAELNSLRAAKKRFESGKEVSLLKVDLEKEKRKNAVLTDQVNKYKAENKELRADRDSYRNSYEIENGLYRTLVEKYTSLQNIVSDHSLTNDETLWSAIDKLVLDLVADNEDKDGQIAKLKAQINRDFHTSSSPSSQFPNRAPIQNGREKTGRKQGGQRGHKGHSRKQLKTTEPIVNLAFPDDVMKNPEDYEYVGVKARKLVDIETKVHVTEVHSAVFRNKLTGKEVYRDFPDGMENEINYGAGLKAYCNLMNNYLNVPLRKCASFLNDITHGTIEIAPSTIFSLGRAFSKRTKKERGKIFINLLNSPFMHSDATTIRICGVLYFVYVSSNGKDVLYQFRRKKGDEGIKGTPVEEYLFVLIHDHDVTYFKYGGKHQKCEAHEARYVKDSMANEPDLEWNKLMDEHLKWIIHNFKIGNLADDESIRKAKERYYEILELAMKEYSEMPETKIKYYKHGYNTAKRLKEYGEELLYFLTHPEIPYTNNECERRGRRLKSKMRVIGTFRSFQSAIDYLKFMSYMETERDTIGNKYEKLVEVFS